jgi:hypothetical protein
VNLSGTAPRREWPSDGRSAEKRNELPPSYTDCHLTSPSVDHGRCNVGNNITPQIGGSVTYVTVLRRRKRLAVLPQCKRSLLAQNGHRMSIAQCPLLGNSGRVLLSFYEYTPQSLFPGPGRPRRSPIPHTEFALNCRRDSRVLPGQPRQVNSASGQWLGLRRSDPTGNAQIDLVRGAWSSPIQKIKIWD